MHHLKDYKGFADARIELLQPFSLLIGPNGSGKSNVIEAIELLSFVASGRPLHEIGDVGRGGNGLQVRGGLQSCGRMGRDRFVLGFVARAKFEYEQELLDFRVEICTRPRPRIAEECLGIGNRTLYETLPTQQDSPASDIKVRYDNFARGGIKPQARVSSGRSMLSQYQEFSTSNKRLKSCLRLVRIVMAHLQAPFVFDPNPKRMRNYERVGDSILKRDGSNLSAVLYGLSEGDDDQHATLNRLLDGVSQLPDEPFVKFDFTRTDLGDVIFSLRESSGYTVDARVLSDGTLRILAILTAFETVSEGSRIVVEEFDNGLHPSRVGVLTEAIAKVAEKRNLKVLVTTHNPATMNFLTREQLEGVVLCTWDAEKGSANLVRLDQLARYDELLERGRLGDLVARRAIEQHLVPDFEERQRNKVMKWLEDVS